MKILAFILSLLFCSSLVPAKGGVESESLSGRVMVSYVNDELLLPSEAKVLFDGKEFTGSAPAPKDQLCLISFRNKNYLYYTGMPPAELSDSTSRRAVGYFICNLSTGDPLLYFAGKELADVSVPNEEFGGLRVQLAEKSYSSRSFFLPDWSYETPTKFEMYDCENYLCIRNLIKRMGLIYQNGKDAVGNVIDNEKSSILLPRGNLMDINWTAIFTDGNVIQTLEKDNTNLIGGALETYGSSIRLISNPFCWSALMKKNQEALKYCNRDLLVKVNLIDFAYYSLKGVEEIVGVLPAPVLDCYASKFIGEMMQSGALALAQKLITNDDGTVRKSFSRMSGELFKNFLNCTTQNALLPKAKEFLDIVSALNWIIDDTYVAQSEIMDAEVYDYWQPWGE